MITLPLSGARTKMVEWRGGEIEFGNGTKNEFMSHPPWWIVRYKGGVWGHWCYSWIDYCGPPKVFLTRKQAEIHAKAFRKQYGGGQQFGNGPLKVEVVRIDI
jgi:hypothetical protein